VFILTALKTRQPLSRHDRRLGLFSYLSVTIQGTLHAGGDSPGALNNYLKPPVGD